MRFRFLIPLAALFLISAAPAQVTEVFSKHVSVFDPHGDFTQQLIKTAPGSGDTWRLVDDQKNGFKVMVPESATIDATPSGNRVLQVTFAGGPQKPAPIFRVDAFTPEEDDPIEVTQKYAADYAENYPELAFNGKFSVADSGMMVLTKRKVKTPMALVGGSYLQGAVPCYRVQCALLSKKQQLFLTFDCVDKDWAKHNVVLAALLLSFEYTGKK
jgi:hypothetical protein